MGRTYLKDRAYAVLKGLLLDGTILPGEFLSERKLGEMLGMSKTPIRSALERLEVEGFVKTAPQQGILVRELSIREIRDHYEIRAALETYIVQQLAGKLSSEQTAELEYNLSRQQACIDSGDIPGHVAADAAFHLLLASYFGNHEIQKVMQHQRDRIFQIAIQISRRHPPRMQASLEEHRGIFESLQDGDGEVAALRVKQHFESGKKFLLAG
jgi:DNA-binding GntR family transcriptional regulator